MSLDEDEVTLWDVTASDDDKKVTLETRRSFSMAFFRVLSWECPSRARQKSSKYTACWKGPGHGP